MKSSIGSSKLLFLLSLSYISITNALSTTPKRIKDGRNGIVFPRGIGIKQTNMGEISYSNNDDIFAMRSRGFTIIKPMQHKNTFLLRDVSYLSLDRSLIPRIPMVVRFLVVLLVSVLAICKKLVGEQFDDRDDDYDDNDDNDDDSDRRKGKSKNGRLAESSGVIEKIFNFITSIPSSIAGNCKAIFKGKEEDAEDVGILDINDWNICSLESKEQLSEDYCKVRFSLKSNPSSIFALGLGQEIILCAPDQSGKVLKASLFPTTVSKGYFEIVYRNDDDEFSLVLDSLIETDEIGFKAGKFQLVYRGPEDPIKSITMVTSGLGITPTVQLLKTVLSDSSTNIEDLEMLWINERKDDFILNQEVENLELKYIDNLFVTRVVDKDIVNSETKINEKVQGAVTPFEEGRIAVFFGTKDIEDKCLDLLERMGYARNTIVSMITN